MSSNEGGTIPEELRVNIARERTEAYGAAFMGLTVGCAVCHDHKYDPTTQKDFYQLSAFFNNIDEQPFNDDKPDWAPVVRDSQAAESGSIQPGAGEAGRTAESSWMRRGCRSASADRSIGFASKQNPAQPVSTDKLLAAPAAG